jgi:hypothetical protein
MINRLWWIDPGNLLILLVLPVFVVSAVYGGPFIPQFGSFNFLTTSMIILGAVCIITLAVGAKLGTAATARLDIRFIAFVPHRFDQLIILFLAISLLAYLLLLGPLLADPELMLSVLRGDKGAIFIAKAKMGWLVGVTSLTNITPLLLCMCSIRFIMWGRFLPSRAAVVAVSFLPLFLLVHAFIGSERFVLIENGIAILLPLFSFWAPLKGVGRSAPFVGALAFVVIFAAGEYMRSWAYYGSQFDSFAEFAGMRLLAYIAVASNTGAGMVLTMPPVGYPLITARWFWRLTTGPSGISYQDQYFKSFGNVEFNNPGGNFSPIVDFGVPLGLVYLFLFGILIGVLYGYYRRRHPVGLLAYPLFYIGLVDLTQIWYWGEPRFVPRLIFLALAVMVAVRRIVVLRPVNGLQRPS